MSIGQVIKRNGEKYKIYKVQEFKAFAENEDKTNIICIQRPSYLQIVK